MFSALRQGNTLYILDKTDGTELKVGQVVSVSSPVTKYVPSNPQLGIGMNTETVVDISAKVGDETFDFKQLPSGQSMANYGKAVVSETREALVPEVDGIMNESLRIIDKDNIAYHTKRAEQCENILRTLNPAYAKEQERDEEIQSLKSRFDGVEQSLANIERLLSKGAK